MRYVISWIIVFTIVYLFYLFFVILRKDKLQKFGDNSFLKYLVKVYDLNIKKLDLKKMANIIAIVNGIILATTFEIVAFVKNFFLSMALAFAVLIVLQIVIYHIIGVILKRSEKNV